MVANEKWFGASKGFYPETIDQSLRFEDGDSSYMTRTFVSPTNNTTWSYSAWIKLSNTGLTRVLLGGASTNYGSIGIESNDKLTFWTNAGATAGASTALLRDTTNWYHIFVVSNGTNIKGYVNNQLLLTYTGTITNLNSAIQHQIGRFGGLSYYFDGYMAEVNFVDGTELAPSDFGEEKNSVWIPKTLSSLTYGNNGFRLTFADSSNLGDDTSGNGNDFTSSGLASSDSVSDTPTNNFATLNVLQTSNNASTFYFSEGNLALNVTNNSGYRNCSATFSPMGIKGYFEFCVTTGTPNFYIGVIEDTTHPTNGDYGDTSHNYTMLNSNSGVYQNAVIGSQGNKIVRGGSTYLPHNIGTISAGDVLGMAFDFTGTNRRIWFHRANTYGTSSSGVGNPSTGANPVQSETYLNSTHGYRFHFGANTGSGLQTIIFNFGQDGTFNGTKTAQGNTDANGNGNFFYEPPTDFLALCSASLSDTTLSPNQSEQADDHFNTVLWSGNATARDISVGFEADWVWTKMRSHDNAHYIYDSSRGDNTDIYSNLTQQESTTSGRLTFGYTDGFSLGTDAQTNGSGYTFVGWCWNGEGSAPTKTYKVVVVSDSGNKYRFRNSTDSATFSQSAVTLDLQEGGTYVFDWSDSSAQGHPIRFSTTSDGTHGGGSEYTTGVVKDDSAYKTTITIPSSAPQLYYYCANHSGMGGSVNTNSTHGSTNFDGSILSVSQTNKTAGFSIVTYTGNGTSNADVTIGHGLGATPRMVIVKNRTDSGRRWQIYHEDLSADSSYTKKNIILNLSNAESGYSSQIKAVSSTTFTVRDVDANNNMHVNKSGSNYVAYVFAQIDGYSKFGSYTGNNSTNGAFVNTGFRPAWVLIKQTNSTGSWVMHDNKRSPLNVIDEDLFANLSSDESDNGLDKDFISSGFKLRSSHSAVNGNGSTYIYMAFAEQPFKFSNAR